MIREINLEKSIIEEYLLSHIQDGNTVKIKLNSMMTEEFKILFREYMEYLELNSEPENKIDKKNYKIKVSEYERRLEDLNYAKVCKMRVIEKYLNTLYKDFNVLYKDFNVLYMESHKPYLMKDNNFLI